jgi:hypothetical protein
VRRPSNRFRRALAAGLILAFPAGALLFLRVPVLTVQEVRAGQTLFSEQVRAGERFLLSYRHSVTQGRVFGTFEIEGDGSLRVLETAFGSPGPGLPEPRPGEDYEISGGMVRYREGGQRLPEISVFVHPFTDHTLVVKGKPLLLSRQAQSGKLVKIRVERRFLWRRAIQKIGALLSLAR